MDFPCERLRITTFSNMFEKAVKEEQEPNEAAGKVKNHLSVSGDGSWSKRGFTSLIGIVSLIGKCTGKIMDVIVKSRYWQMCASRAGKMDEIEFDAWYEDHRAECTMNHSGSSGKMEVDGVLEMFKRSVEVYNVYYKNYIGDGDTKTFKCLKDSLPYGEEFEISKLKCVEGNAPALKKIYEDLSTDDLLSRCLRANTQNNNECFNSTVWNLAPKHTFCGKKIVDLATDCAICLFNEGSTTVLKIMETMGVTIGAGAAATATRHDECRIRTAGGHGREAAKEHRSNIRADRSRENELFDDVEGFLYGAGKAD